jgi:hypothetical protein
VCGNLGFDFDGRGSFQLSRLHGSGILDGLKLSSLGGSGSDIGGLTASNAATRGGRGLGWSRLRGSRDRPAAPPGGGGCRGRRPFDPCALLPLPARAHPRDLVIGQHAQMAADGYVHRAEKLDHIIRRDAELAGHVMYAQLAQDEPS